VPIIPAAGEAEMRVLVQGQPRQKSLTLPQKIKGERKREEVYGNIIEGVNLFKVHCTHLWN
jgi:ribosomal protein S6E (S10)